MNKPFYAVAVLLTLCSCGASENKQTSTPTADAKTAAPAEVKLSPEAERGETLIAKSDCLGCHKIEEKLQGPAYREVAAKYANAPAGIADTLAQRIIKGHVGVWGQTPMTAHPALSEADAKAMVVYVLSLKQ